MTWFPWALPIVTALLAATPAPPQLVPPSAPKTLTTKDNEKTVVVRGGRFVVALPHRSRFQWEPLPKGAAPAAVAPRELKDLRKFDPSKGTDPNLVGGYSMQLSTFELPAGGDAPIRLELVYTDRDPKAPKDGALYKPKGEDLSVKDNRPEPYMHYVVTLKRE